MLVVQMPVRNSSISNVRKCAGMYISVQQYGMAYADRSFTISPSSFADRRTLKAKSGQPEVSAPGASRGQQPLGRISKACLESLALSDFTRPRV